MAATKNDKNSDWGSCKKFKLTYRTTHGLHGLLAGKVFREAEVDHFDAGWVALIGKHKVFWLDVSVANVLRVQIDQC